MNTPQASLDPAAAAAITNTSRCQNTSKARRERKGGVDVGYLQPGFQDRVPMENNRWSVSVFFRLKITAPIGPSVAHREKKREEEGEEKEKGGARMRGKEGKTEAQKTGRRGGE